MPAPDTLPPEVRRDLDAMDAAVAGRTPEGGDAVLAELAALLASDRPAPDPRWAQRLDARAAKGFAKPRRLRLPSGWLVPAGTLGAAALVIVVVSLAVHQRGAVTSESAGAGGAGSAASSAGSAAAPVVRARKVERTASMRLGAPRRDLDETAGAITRVTGQLGGFVASSTLDSRTGGELDLRIPAARLDDAIARISRLGHVRRLERSTLDITDLAVSARTRVRDLVAERRSLLRQLAGATTLAQTDKLRNRLTAVNRQLAAARADARRIAGRAAFATLSVELVGERAKASAAPGGGHWTPGDAWHDALRVLEVAAGIALVAFAIALPLVVLGAPAWLTARHMTLRRL